MCAESTGSSESVSGLEEIVVTAQKREENLQSVPVTVTALSSAMLERQGIAAFTDLPRVVPALTIKAARNFPTSSISLRGIGTFAFSIGIEPSVSVVVDDVAVALQSQAYNYLNDIERIEVLEGPQGTLFGKNASAGVVNIVTKDPSPAWSGSLRQSFAETSELRTDASLSGPLGARAGIRLSGYVQSSGGYVADLTNGLRLNNSDGGGVRGKLRLAVTDHLEIMLSADHNSATSRGTARTYRSLPADAQLFGVIPVAGFASGIAPGPRNFSVRLDSIPRNNSDQSTWALKAALDLGRQRLTAISSDQRWHYFNNQDSDGSDADVLGALIGCEAHGGVGQSASIVNQ